MPKFAANLSLMYNEHAFLERFSAAAADGFAGVEFLFPYDFAALEIRARLDGASLTQVLFNAPPGDWGAGERGIAALPEREEEFRRGFDQALEYAAVLGNRHLHVMAGLLQSGQDRARQHEVYLANLAHAAREAASAGITVLIEPINPRDMPGYFLNRQAEAHAICREVGAANLMVQCDLYHCQIVEGDLATTLRRDLAGIGHIQIAGVPQRHEPDLGEINYPYLFDLMDALGYAGWVGCEYRPRAGTSEGLAWLQAWRERQTINLQPGLA
ncbi:2-oxo-tetronate isomerase [Janthinobacterium sp. 17J80-10]|uniref:2-oxo-tetronate isomerase n=1 Tax=Janthinobacterium sp. 17J80-10 TaxID=2497863 RepID=UPI0010057944|nr:2-oxo-tetronate isomerase [Janthinobacterium sp. 17J80-10]QAU34309.1 hydroxypyruvate isomerase family protein [Janthinobacterium sp. 17J80-10]